MSTLPVIVERRSRSSDPGLAALSALTGQMLLDATADWLRETLGCFAVSIGDRAGDLGHLVRIRAFRGEDPALCPTDYPLLGAPCRDVLTRDEPLAVVRDVTIDYPNDAMFRELGIASYVGVPLRSPAGRPIGLVCVFDVQAMEKGDEVQALLEWLAPRLGRELHNLRQQEYLLGSTQWTAQPHPDQVLGGLTRAVTSAMQVSTCIITEWVAEAPERYRIVACCHAGEDWTTLSRATWPFAVSPCARLRAGDDTVFVADELARRWPDSPLVTVCSANACYSLVLRSRSGEPLGHLILGHVREVHERLVMEPGLSLFRARAAAELDRVRLDRERRQMADSLLSKQKLETLGLMAGGIAHDFNNLLVAILGNADLAMQHVNGQGTHYLSKVETAALRAGDILRQLLEYSGRGSGEPEAVDLSEAVRNARELLTLSTGRNARAHYELADDLPAAWVDAAQLQQVIINLVLNAAEALDGNNGDVMIRTRLTTLTSEQIHELSRGKDLAPGPYLELEVTDTGVGMDRSTRERIFDPFFTSKPTGRGLGLSALQGFVSASHAGIGVDSEPGAGTRMSLYLRPEGEVPRPTAAAPAAESPPLAIDRPVLVVDDDEAVRAVTADLLTSLAYPVQTCDNGEHAITACQAGGDYAAAFIDISMPGLDGWTTLACLREQQPQLPVVMMSGYAHQDRASELAQERQAEFLRKPFRRDDLHRALERAIAGRRAAAEPPGP